jgi:hypothetical protein
MKVGVFNVWILVDVVHALGVKQAGPALDAVHDVAFFEQKFSQVGSVLAGDTGDKGHFGVRLLGC